ncbi:MAG: hypothetical protein K6A05_04785 [Lachnospiraceae bacterium]|nr:hypothetical protein [Lachnospiraceae bacterium]
MKNKETGAKIIFGVFLAVICFSWVWWLVFQRFTDTTNYENRELAAAPSLSLESYTTFASDFTDYFNDRIPFRNALIRLNNSIDYFVANQSSNPNVIKGEDGWLFYTDPDQGDSLGAYQGMNLYTEDELAIIAANCVAQKDFLAAQGKEFVLFIAPNKMRVYSEYMPLMYGESADLYPALQVYEYLKSNTDVRVVYPNEALIDAKSMVSENLYFHTDTHWNQIGAYVGARELLTELGVDIPAVNDSALSIMPLSDYYGDLANMLGLGHELQGSDYVYHVEGYDLHNCEILTQNPFGRSAYHSSGGDPRSCYMICDSYGPYMSEYIGSQFSDTVVQYANSFDYADLSSGNPDIVVYEVVERFVERLATFSIENSNVN